MLTFQLLLKSSSERSV